MFFLHTARLFSWHCWGILPSLQAASSLLAKQIAKNARGGELSPINQRRELNTYHPKFWWLLICCIKIFLLLLWGTLHWKKKSTNAIFSGTLRNQQAHSVHGLRKLPTWSSSSNRGRRQISLSTQHRLGHKWYAELLTPFRSKWTNGKVKFKM